MLIDKIMRPWSHSLVTSTLLVILALSSLPASALQVEQDRQGSDVDGGYDHELEPLARAVHTDEP